MDGDRAGRVAWSGSSRTSSRFSDVNGKYELDFKSYALGEPKYTVEECIERDMTYAAPLKATLPLNVFEDVDGQRRLKNQIETRGLSRRAADHDAARHLRHQRRRAGGV